MFASAFKDNPARAVRQIEARLVTNGRRRLKRAIADWQNLNGCAGCWLCHGLSRRRFEPSKQPRFGGCCS